MLDVVSGAPSRDLYIDYGQTNTSKISARPYVHVKRCIDIIATLVLAPIALAIVGILALLVRRDGGNAFFCQPRVGRNGKVFKLWKLRTWCRMRTKSCGRTWSATPALGPSGRRRKTADTSRITPIGRYLRKYSADEVPQLWNVFVGQMSLVGPRPMCPEQQSQYPGVAYFQVRPGMTGLWQIGARNSCSFAERAIYDNEYARAMSFAKDIQILLSTPYVVLRGTGL